MSDVAARAGVSHQTVSRVLNDHPSVRPETRDRVLAAIADLGYRRNRAARALVTRRSGTLGVLTTSSAHHGPASTVLSLERAAREVGYYVSVAAIDRFDPVTLRGVLDHFLDEAVEGIVIVAPQVDVAEAVTAFAAPVPVVTVSSGPVEPAGSGVVTVGVDQRSGARQVVRHLVALGHTEVVHVAGPLDWFDAQARLAGWREATAEDGVAAPDPVLADWSAASGYRTGLRLADAGLPTAVLAANDQLATGLLRAFWERGISVPGDVSVAGFDDEAHTGFLIPPLTTVRQDFAALGRSAITALVRAVAGEQVPDIVLPATLIPRDSTGPARG